MALPQISRFGLGVLLCVSLRISPTSGLVVHGLRKELSLRMATAPRRSDRLMCALENVPGDPQVDVGSEKPQASMAARSPPSRMVARAPDSPIRNPIVDKLPAALECGRRPLREGEEPKRAGQNFIFEAFGGLNPSLDTTQLTSVSATVKHDGSCCFVTDAGTLCRRRDIRPGKSRRVPPNALRPDGTPAQEGDEVCWLPVLASGPVLAEDVQHRSALVAGRDGWAHSVDLAGEPVEIPLRAGCSYELLGPSIQGNPYALPEERVPVPVVSKDGKTSVKKAARHYLLEHGVVEAAGWDMAGFVASPLEYARDYIVSREVEGVVLYTTDGGAWKINRGHIGAPTKQGRFRLSAAEAAAAVEPKGEQETEGDEGEIPFSLETWTAAKYALFDAFSPLAMGRLSTAASQFDGGADDVDDEDVEDDE